MSATKDAERERDERAERIAERAKIQDPTPEQETMLMIRGAISSMDQETQGRVSAAYAAINAMKAVHGEDATIMAVALMGAEIAAE